MKKYVLVRFNTEICSFYNKTFDTMEEAQNEMKEQYDRIANDDEVEVKYGDIYEESAYLVDVNGWEYDWEIIEVIF